MYSTVEFWIFSFCVASPVAFFLGMTFADWLRLRSERNARRKHEEDLNRIKFQSMYERIDDMQRTMNIVHYKLNNMQELYPKKKISFKDECPIRNPSKKK